MDEIYLTTKQKIDNTQKMVSLLRARYQSPAYAFLSQVRNQTGYSNSHDGIRTADALALSLYPSRGLHLNGFEIKISRSDWMHEVKDPSKADAIGRYCDFFWLFIADKDMVKDGELPATWGLLVPSGNGTKVIKEPIHLNPPPIPTSLLCGIMRNVDETYVPKYQLDDRVKKLAEESLKSEEWKLKYEVEQCKKLRETISSFEKISGIKIDTYRGDDIASAVSVVLSEKRYWKNPTKRLIDLKREILEISEEIEEVIQKSNKKELT